MYVCYGIGREFGVSVWVGLKLNDISHLKFFKVKTRKVKLRVREPG